MHASRARGVPRRRTRSWCNVDGDRRQVRRARGPGRRATPESVPPHGARPDTLSSDHNQRPPMRAPLGTFRRSRWAQGAPGRRARVFRVRSSERPNRCCIVSAAIAVERSGNRKIGDASATYVAQASCPPTCAFLGAGCYAESGRMALHTRALNARVDASGPLGLAREEAAAIGHLTGLRPLRLHVVGDASTTAAARVLAAAVARRGCKEGPTDGRPPYSAPTWTYTHAWRTVARKAWGAISVLASCESLADVRRAMRRGYAAALVVAQHPADGRAYQREDLTLIPCPEQTRGRTCTECRLCFDAEALHARGAVITFAAHGSRRRMVEGKLS